MMTMQAAILVKETADKISALMFLVVLLLWDSMFHLGSVFNVINLE